MVDDRHAAQVTEIETMTADYLRENAPAVIPEIISGGCYYSVSKESWLAKFWRRLGFRRPHVERPCESIAGLAEGCLIVSTVTHFDWKDRLRILVSGNVAIENVVQTDVTVLRSYSYAASGVLPPWEK